MDAKTLQKILQSQKNEITEHFIYSRLAVKIKHEHNKKILHNIATDELNHYNFWKTFTSKEVAPNKLKINFYYFMARLFGLTFALRLMEKGEQSAQINYDFLKFVAPEVSKIIEDENRHEDELLQMLDEEGLKYTSSVILGLNDAIVELTSALAGLTLALQQTKLVAIAGIITGIAASMSMAASSYLSSKDAGDKNPFKSSIYTGFAYIITVILLIAPYLIFKNAFICLGVSFGIAVLVIFIFSFYTSVAKNIGFRKRFFEIAGISLLVAAINFCIGLLVRKFIGVDI